MSVPVLFGIVVLALGCAFVRTHMRAWQLSRMGWEALLAQLEPLPIEGITLVARDYLFPEKGQLRIDTADLWLLIGGEEGLRRMDANAKVLVALAGYAQRWNPVEGVIVAERMRRDGARLRRAALNLSIGYLDGRGNVRGPFNAQEVASAYHLMRQRLLALYETSHAGRYSHLAMAV